MIEVHLIGYTADLRHLVLDVDANEERGRYRLVVDGDLFATLDDVRQQRFDEGLDVGVWQPEESWEDDEVLDDEAVHEELFEEPEPAAPIEAAPAVAQDDEVEEDLLEDDLLFGDTEEEIRPLDHDESVQADEVEDDTDPVLTALLDRASADSAEDASPSVRIVAAPQVAAPVEEPDEPIVENDVVAEFDDDEWEYEYEDEDEAPETDAPDALAVEVEAEAVEVEVEVVEEPAAAAPAPVPAPVLDSDIPRKKPTALPSQLARRHTAEGLEIPSDAKLSPAEIQAELRGGKSVRAVAKAAGTDPAWVKRWLEPIRAEQTRIVEQARLLTVVNRKGQASALPLAEASDVRLKRRKIDPASVSWDAVRRADGTWKISCKFEEKGRARTASWLWPRGETRLSPASELAREVGWVDRRLARSL